MRDEPLEEILMRTKSRVSWRHAGPRVALAAALVVGLLLVPGLVAAAGLGPVEGGALPGPLPVFPPDNWWNTDVSGAPVDAGSPAFITFIGGTARRLHPDLGGTVSPGSAEIYGMPYVVVDGTQPKLVVDFVLYGGESDGVGVPFYPIPTQAITQPHWVEGGDPGNVDARDQDRHLLIIDRDNKLLYELYNVFYNSGTGRWEAGSGAFWDMKTNNRRPEGWTSADAAGLAIFPGLLRYDEAYDPAVAEIQHAFRVTVRATNGHVYPASHDAGSTNGALPMGARLRLKAGKDISGFTPEVQKIFRAMKKYGLIVADNGSDMYIGGTFDTRWNNDVLNPAFAALTAGDFEVVQLGWKPASGGGAPSLVSLGVSPASVQGGQPSTGAVALSAPAPASGATVLLSSANNAVVQVPASVSVAAGATSASFSIATAAVTASTVVGINASYGGATKSAALTATPAPPPPPPPPPPAPTLSSLALNPVSVFGGAKSIGTVTLSGPAPTGGAVVALASTRPSAASVPPTVTVPEGKSTASFTVSTAATPRQLSVTVSASLAGVKKTATLTVRRTR
jgi:hypothetical protein